MIMVLITRGMRRTEKNFSRRLICRSSCGISLLLRNSDAFWSSSKHPRHRGSGGDHPLPNVWSKVSKVFEPDPWLCGSTTAARESDRTSEEEHSTPSGHNID